MSNHFLIPAIPEQGDNEILKLLQRQSILWQKQLPHQSPRRSSQTSPQYIPARCSPWLGPLPPANTGPTRRAEPTEVGYGDPPAQFPTPSERFDSLGGLGWVLWTPGGSQGNQSEEEHGALWPLVAWVH